MNWQQIAADALQPFERVQESEISDLADDLAMTARQFIRDRDIRQQDAIEAIREARWNARIDEVRRK